MMRSGSLGAMKTLLVLNASGRITRPSPVTTNRFAESWRAANPDGRVLGSRPESTTTRQRRLYRRAFTLRQNALLPPERPCRVKH
jgi:hypothetical protein